MSFNTLSRRNVYIGDGTTTVFPYNFKIFNPAYIRVLKKTVAGVELTLTLGGDYTVAGAGLAAGGNVTLNVAPAVNETLVLLGGQPLSQDMSIRNQDAYYPATIEDGADQSRMIDQQQEEKLQRSIRLSPTSASLATKLVLSGAPDKYKILRLNSVGTGFEVVDPAQIFFGGGGVPTGKLKIPTDGAFGGPLGNPANLAVDDLYEDAFDKVATLLSKLTPAGAALLSAKILSLTTSYQAKGAADGVLHVAVTDLPNPTITPGLTATLANAFSDADTGVLSGVIDGQPAGSVTLTTADDTGLTNGQVSVINDFDPYLGQAGKEGIVRALTAKIVGSGLSVGVHTASLTHSTTGSTSITFYVDDPTTPSVGSTSMTPSGATASKSGVPYFTTGATLTVGFTISGAIRSHYNSTQVASLTSPQTNSVSKSPASAPGVNSAYTDTAALTVTGGYSENVQATITGYNSKGATSTGTASATVRVDTLGAETRVQSGTLQYPSTGYGGAYDSTQSLASNKELQYIAGAYRYPPAVSYAASKPAGPDYSALTPDSYASMRWVTFNFGSVSSASSVTFTLQSASGFTSALQSGVVIYVRVDGAAPTAGWVDANAAYPGTGSPTNNGDAALDVAQSSGLVKRVTFGVTVRTGTVYVRIGIPSGSTKYFGGIA